MLERFPSPIEGNLALKGRYLCRRKQRITTRKPPNIMSTPPGITVKLPSIMNRAIIRRLHTMHN